MRARLDIFWPMKFQRIECNNFVKRFRWRFFLFFFFINLTTFCGNFARRKKDFPQYVCVKKCFYRKSLYFRETHVNFFKNIHVGRQCFLSMQKFLYFKEIKHLLTRNSYIRRKQFVLNIHFTYDSVRKFFQKRINIWSLFTSKDHHLIKKKKTFSLRNSRISNESNISAYFVIFLEHILRKIFSEELQRE